MLRTTSTPTLAARPLPVDSREGRQRAASVASILTASLGLLGCASGSPSHDPTTIAGTTAMGAIEGRPTFQMPIAIPSTEVVMVPFALQSAKTLFEDDDPYTRGGIAYMPASAAASTRYDRSVETRQSDVRWHNVIFRDLRSGEEWPLLEKRGIIGRWHMFGHAAIKDQPWTCRGLVFIAVTDDTNRDGSLDDRDARVAILTDPNGRKPRVISPTDSQVWSVASSDTLDVLHLMIARDTNADGRFDFQDVATPNWMWLSDQGPALPTTSEAMRERVCGLLK